MIEITPSAGPSLPITFTVRGQEYSFTVLDEAAVDLDPTVLLFRGDEEEAIMTLHLDPAAKCREIAIRPGGEHGHLVARRPVP